MKSFVLPSVFLVGVGLIAGTMGLFSFQNAAQARLEQKNAELALDESVTQRDLLQHKRDQMEKDTKPADDYIAHWKDTFMTSDDSQRILASLDSLAVSNLATSSNKENKADVGYTFRSKVITALSVTIAVSGDYYRILNWLGATERQYPLARIESVVLNNEQGLKMTTKLSFPLNFKLPAEPAKPVAINVAKP